LEQFLPPVDPDLGKLDDQDGVLGRETAAGLMTSAHFLCQRLRGVALEIKRLLK